MESGTKESVTMETKTEVDKTDLMELCTKIAELNEFAASLQNRMGTLRANFSGFPCPSAVDNAKFEKPDNALQEQIQELSLLREKLNELANLITYFEHRLWVDRLDTKLNC